jgi:beta-glucosidase
VAGADVVVAAVGLTSDLEGEEMPVKVEGFAGGDKTSLDLPADQRALLESASAGQAAGGGGDERQRHRPELGQGQRQRHLEAWYPGEQGGLAVASVFRGRSIRPGACR